MVCRRGFCRSTAQLGSSIWASDGVMLPLQSQVPEPDSLHGYRCLFRAEDVWGLARRRTSFHNWYTKLTLTCRQTIRHRIARESMTCPPTEAGRQWRGDFPCLVYRCDCAHYQEKKLQRIAISGFQGTFEAPLRRPHLPGSDLCCNLQALAVHGMYLFETPA